MATICEICGDKGFSEALIYCDKCQIDAQHRYCLEKLPETFTEYVTWFCEGCAPKKVKLIPVKAITAPSRKSDRLSAKSCTEGRIALKRDNIGGSSAARIEDGQNHENSHLQPCKAQGSENLQKLEKRRLVLIGSANADEKAECSKLVKDQILGEAESSKVNNDQKIGEAGSSKMNQNQKFEESESSKISDNHLKLEEVESNKINNENQKLDEAESSKMITILEDKGNTDEDAESSKMNTNDDPVNTSGQNIDAPSQPIDDPVWRGRFSIGDTKFSSMDGLAAHLSTKACLKVCEEASLLPELLISDMLPRDDVWPKSFSSSGPRDDHIALYFFPENEINERVFDSLVEYMIEEDLAMRAVVVNAELLVFTSRQLPLAYWRFQAKYYLWGVFRRKHPSYSQQVEGHLIVHNSIDESAVTTVSIAEERHHKKTLAWDRRSPISPLSDGNYR